MLAFIDESGLPHPNDGSDYPVVLAVCFDEQHSRAISRRIYAMKRGVLQAERAELKGQRLLKEKAYRGSPVKRVFAEHFFSSLRDMPVTVFAAIMQSPFVGPQRMEQDLLGYRFRVLLERIDLLAAERSSYASLMFDGRGTRFGQLSSLFSNYLFRSNEGQARTRIADSPAFVDSAYSTGIQIADMCAYALRVYYEKELAANSPRANDEYSHAVIRWYRVIQRLTRDFAAGGGERRPGLYRLPRGVR